MDDPMCLKDLQTPSSWPLPITVLFLTLAMCFPLQAATPDMSGNWVVRIEATEVSNGTPNYVRLTLDQDGSELSGALPNGPISGSVEESGAFQIETPWQTWTGSVQGDEFTATTTSTDLWRWPLSLSASRQSLHLRSHRFMRSIHRNFIFTTRAAFLRYYTSRREIP